MKTVFLFFFVVISTLAQNSQQQVLLVGTFHFNNPGLDVAKTKSFDIMSTKSQKELEQISKKIKAYRPDKIFVEWEFDKQASLDTLYNLYLKGEYFDYVATKYPKRKFYVQNEIIQLAFRTAKKAGHSKVFAIDYQYAGDFPYDSLMKVAEEAHQNTLINEIKDETAEFVSTANKDFETMSLTQILINRNNTQNRIKDISAYISQFNRVGNQDNFVGAYLNAEWYKRNLYMYAFMQKNIGEKDKKVMVLLGASHIAMFKTFIDLDTKLKTVELKSILN